MIRTVTLIITGFILFSGLTHAEDETRDFYAEPGLNPFRTAMGQDLSEHIDPFNGSLQLSYLDLLIPGNGGLDIEITRYYNLPQGSPGYGNPFGYGWTMHFGRITIGSGHASQLCDSASIPGGDTSNNPSIEMPSGGRELLARSSTLDDGSYITRSNWRARCIDPNDYRKGLVATSPEGTAYYMREYVLMQGEDGPSGEPAPLVETWLTNAIVDVHGNSLEIHYQAIASGMKLAVRVDASDGRQVTLDYVDSDGSPVQASSVNARLSEVSANGHSWRYHYAPVDEARTGWGQVDHYLLTAVERPDGSRWEYGYGQEPADPGYRRLTRLVYPSGGSVDYSYQHVWPYLPQQDFHITAIQHKTQNNPGHPSGSWSWEFFPGAVDMADLGVEPVAENTGRMADFTRITTPAGEEHVFHVGYWALVDTHDLLWQMGLKLKHQHLEDSGAGGLQVLRSLSNAWSPREISAEVFRGGILSALWDGRTYAPVLSRQSVLLDGYLYAVDFLEHDAFGNPGTSVHHSTYTGENDSLRISYGYLNDTDNWLIGLPETETTSEGALTLGVVIRSFGDTGLLINENRYGVETQYGYTPEGDLASVTDARGNQTRFSDYFRGTPRLEQRPDGSSQQTLVNPEATVAARISGRGHITAFTYDGLNRLVGIDFPLGEDVSISWGAQGKTLTRGQYREVLEWDGFGRETRRSRTDLARGLSYTRRFGLDGMGRRIFESNVNSALGITRELDMVGRPRRVINQDGSSRIITHQGAHRELHQDENGNTTEYLYQVFGMPDKRQLIWVISPESVATRMQRDVLGNIRSVFQGEPDSGNPQQYLGYIQYYDYNERLQLTAIDSPADIGLTSYGRDVLGNMVSRQVAGGSLVTYTYDGLNRLVASDYPDDSIDVSRSYDEDGHLVSVVNGYGRRFYQYDDNGNLSTEELWIDDALYRVTYGYDSLDHLATMSYPSGRVVDYAPDALGRPSRVAPFLDEVAYAEDGSLGQMVYANGRIARITRTDRKWVDRLTVDTILDLDYGYDPAGNLISIADAHLGGQSRTMRYDSLKRLVGIVGSWGETSYAFDAYGNLVQKGDPAQGNRLQYYQYQGLLLDRVAYSDGWAQRIFNYDDHGNMAFSDDVIFDPISGLPTEVLTRRQFSFDDAGNLRSSRRSSKDQLGYFQALRSGSFTTEYDGNNQRIRKIDHSTNDRYTDYLFSRAGLLLGEYDLAGADYGNEYFYLADRQIATAKYNSPPSVDVGSDQQSGAGSRVVLAAQVQDLDGQVVSYEWKQLSGPEVIIDDPAARETFFDVPPGTGGETILLELTVTDDRGARSSSSLSVAVLENQPPDADAGPDRRAMAGRSLRLDASASLDPEGPVSYHWSGDYLAQAASATPLFSPPEQGQDYIVRLTLTVTDSEGLQDSDELEITVLAMNTDLDGDSMADGWEVFYFGDIAAGDRTGDPDADGLDNYREYLDGISPLLANPATPVLQIEALAGDASNMLLWQRPQAAQGFTVLWSLDAALPLSSWQRESVVDHWFLHRGLENDSSYHYRVAAYNTLGETTPSAELSTVPGARDWQSGPVAAPGLIPHPDWAVIAGNALGEIVLVSREAVAEVHRLYAWFYSPIGGWQAQQLVSESHATHQSVRASIDLQGNLMVAWISDVSGTRNLYASYRPHGGIFEPPALIEQYSGDGQFSGDVLTFDHLEFADDGSAFACWRQQRLHGFAGPTETAAAAAMVNRFDPVSGWGQEQILEAHNNIGSTEELSCDVSGAGRLVAAWERRNSFSEQDSLAAAQDYDVWVSVYEPARGWLELETVEFIQHGIREQGGLGVQNQKPRVAVTGDTAAVLWYNSSDTQVVSITYDYAAGAWQDVDILESRSRRIPGADSHQLAANSSGALMAFWGDRYVTRHDGESSWSKSRALPSIPELQGMDAEGLPYIVHRQGNDVVVNRFDGSGWSQDKLNAASDGSPKKLSGTVGSILGDLSVYWFSGDEMFRSSHAASPQMQSGPVTTLSLEVTKVKGIARYTLSLEVDRDAETYFRFSGQGTIVSGGQSNDNWQTYTGPVVIQMDKRGSGAFEYYSEDSDGNRESSRTEVL